MKLNQITAMASTHTLRFAAPIVHALFKPIYFRVPVSERIVYLTFDDGPGPQTLPLMRHLREAGGLASFFFTGQSCDNAADSARVFIAARESGHAVGCHGYDHLDAWRHSRSKIKLDLERALRSLRALQSINAGHEMGGQTGTKWARPPFGRLTPALRRLYDLNQLNTAMWDVNPVDYGSRARADNVTEFVRRNVRPGSIVLLHENSPLWAQEDGPGLCQLVDDVISDGWKLDCLPNPGRRF